MSLLDSILANDLVCMSTALKAGADINEVVHYSNTFSPSRMESIDATYDGTPLFIGAALGMDNVVGLMLQRGAKETLNQKGKCSEIGHKQEVTYKRGVIDGTPLFIATIRGHWNVMEMLLDAGADYSIEGSIPVMKGYVVSSQQSGTPLQVAGDKVLNLFKRWIIGHMSPEQWLAVFSAYDTKHQGHLSTFEAKKLLTEYNIPDADLANYKSGKKFDFQEFCKLWVSHGCVHQAIIDSAINPPTPPPQDTAASRKGSINRSGSAAGATFGRSGSGSGAGLMRQGSGAGVTRQGSAGPAGLGRSGSIGKPNSPMHKTSGLGASPPAPRKESAIISAPVEKPVSPTITNRKPGSPTIASRKPGSPTTSAVHRPPGPTTSKSTPVIRKTASPISPLKK